MNPRLRLSRPAISFLDACCLLFMVFVLSSIVFQKLESSRLPQTKRLLQTGQTLQVPGVNWTAAPKTLVLALSADSAEVQAAIPFYRQLIERRAGNTWNAVAVFAGSGRREAAFMRDSDLAGVTVATLDLAAAGLLATPTVLVVDRNGRIEQQWIGPVSSADEADIAAHLSIGDWPVAIGVAASEPGGASPIVTTAELLSAIGSGGPVNLVDVRDREGFSTSHVSIATNIPSKELAIRAPHEVRLNEPVIIYCSFSAACAADGQTTLCAEAERSLRSIGFEHVRVVRDSLRLLEERGVPISRAPITR